MVSGLIENSYLKKFYDMTPELNKLHIPALIIHGDKDLFPLWTAKEIQSKIPNAKLVILENCGHFSYTEKPQATFEVIKEFEYDLPN